MEKQKMALVTGATDGIGFETARVLASHGWRVLVHGRNEARAVQAVERLRNEIGQDNFEGVWADFSSLEQVRQLSLQVRDKAPELGLLINNAGLKVATRQKTEDGYELTWGVNHLAPFLLTLLVMDNLRALPGSRVVTVSSVAHRRGHVDFANLQGELGWDSYQAYAQSKLANLIFARALAGQLPGLISHAAHPGAVTTKLLTQGFGIQGNSIASGAAPTLRAALDPVWGTMTGRYSGPQGEEQPSAEALDAEVARRLIEVSVAQTGATWQGPAPSTLT